MKPTVNLKPLHHRNGEQIGIYFSNNAALNILIRSKAGATWSQTNRCWYVPLTREAFEKLNSALKDHAKLETADLTAH